MKSIFHILTILCLAIMIASVDGIASEPRTGTSAAAQLLIPVGARYMAMGGAPISTVEGADAIFWNPAGVDRSAHVADVTFSRMSHIADIGVNYAALRVRFEGLGTLGFSLKAMDIGDIDITTEYAPDGGAGTYSPQFITAGLTYSRLLTDKISIGTTINFVSESVERISASGAAFDFGVQYKGLADVEGLSIGVVVKNIGPAIQYRGSGFYKNSQIDQADRGASPLSIVTQKDELPSFITIGLSYDYVVNEQSNVTLSSSYTDDGFSDDTIRYGFEYNFDNTFFIRTGYSLSPDAPDDANIYGLTAGAGFQYKTEKIGLTVDYTYRDVDFFDASNIFTLSFGF